MLHIEIKTWRCTGCNLDVRDRDPSVQENLDTYMSQYPGLKPNECVNCGTLTLEKVTDSALKTKKNVIDSQKDIDDKRVELEADVMQQVKAGVEFRAETDEEKTKRIGLDVDNRDDLTKTEKNALKAELGAMSNESRQFVAFRPETSLEKGKRIDKEIAKMRVATRKDIKWLKDNFEDK